MTGADTGGADTGGVATGGAGTGGSPAPGLTLRPLTAHDLPRVAELERELFGASAWSPAMLAEELRGPGRDYVAAVTDHAGADGGVDAGPADLVGYAGLWFDGEDAQVMTIGVASAHQGRRVGRRLMAWLVDRAQGLGARTVLLEVRVDNAPALALYERVGFVRMGRRRGYYQPENVDAWTMRLDLAAQPDRAADALGGTGALA